MVIFSDSRLAISQRKRAFFIFLKRVLFGYMKKVAQYPRFSLYYKRLNDEKATTYHTKRKNSFLFRLDGLSEATDLKYVRFVVHYSPLFNNSSIKYQNLKEAQRVARIFTAKSEIDSCMNFAE